MNKRFATPAAVLLLLACSSVAQQEEGSTYFSLSSNRTYGAAETPAIQVWAQGVERLQFRLYRVNDPMRFFAQLDDDHRFGGRAPRPEMEPTPIEKFHGWKVRARRRILNLLRAQYSPATRARIRDWRLNRLAAGQKSAPRAGTEYAGVPILNSKQLVRVWQQPVSSVSRWDSITVPVQTPGRGLYLVEATDGKLRAYTVIFVTEIAVITKSAPGKLLARVVERSSGAPLRDCPLQVFIGDRSKPAADLKTDANGLAVVPINDERPEKVFVVASRQPDWAVVSLYGGGLRSSEESAAKGYLYTDRPVYRPGHTVRFRLVVRVRDENGYRLPADRDWPLEIQDSEGKTVHRQDLRISEFGTAHGSWTVPESASLGYYSLVARREEAYLTGGFHIEEYRKPEYEVKILPASRRVLQGEDIEATIQARFYYGEPVANAKVKWVVHQSRYWPPYFYEDYDSEEPDGPEEYSPGDQLMEQEGELDAEGRLNIRVPTQEARHDTRYRIEARVTDAAGREIAGAGTVLATVGSFYLRVEPEQYVYSPGSRAGFTITALDYDQQPVADVVFRVDMMQYRWSNQPGETIASVPGRTGADGKGRVELPARSGFWRVEAVATTARKRNVTGHTYLWVSGDFAWSEGQQQRLQIVPDRKSYLPGETARVLIFTGAGGGHLWVTVEGRTVHSSQFISTKESTVTVEVPIRKEYAPNFFVGATYIRGQKLSSGNKMIRVPPVEQQLQVSLTPSKNEFRPGEPGVYSIEARDHAGRPVSAEFSLGIVDEAIYAIRPETGQDLLGFFYGRDYNHISTDTSLSYYFSGEAGKRRMQLARIRPYQPRAQLKPERFAEAKVRKAFPDTMYWVADLKTDAAGRAQARVEFPDALTLWRATARGITTDTRVGSAVQRTVVRKNLITRLAVPRFFTEGDLVTVSVIAQNYLTSSKTVRVSLETKGLEVVEGTTRDITVDSRGQGQVDYKVKALPGREAVLLAKTLTDEESDAMELTLPVHSFGVKRSQAKSGAISEASGENTAEIAFPPDAAAGSRSLEIALSPSVAGAVFGALDYLVQFPYGCVEQTMSSFLPNVLVAQAARDLKLNLKLDAAGLQKKVRAGLERLYDFQHDDGGWGWWKTDESHVFMTAYVVAGLRQASRAGYPIEQHRVNRGVEWLKKQWPELARARPELRSYILYAMALAGSKDNAMMEQVWKQRGAMDAYGQALLGLALQEAGDARAREVADMLEQSAQSDETVAWWRADYDSLMEFRGDTSTEATAHAIKFLVQQRPQSPLLAKAAFWLVKQRSGGYYWNSTKQTAMVIYGLTDYLKQSGELQAAFTATVFVNGRQVMSHRFSAADTLNGEAARIRLEAGQLGDARQSIRVVKSGQGRLYWSAAATYFDASRRHEVTGSAALNLVREYFRLSPRKEGQRIVHELQPLEGDLKRGEVIAVRLTLSGSEWRYLMMEDPLPSGCEPIERDDLYEIRNKPRWWGWYFSRRELRDNRAAFFETYFNGRQKQYVYLLKVVNPGSFRVSPARVEPMYQPSFLATTESLNLEVR